MRRQLPTEAMDAFSSRDWSAPDAANQANQLAQKMALEASNDTTGRERGPWNLYGQHHPAVVGRRLHLYSAVRRPSRVSTELDRYLLGIRKHNQKYPISVYWEKVNFGLKLHLRIVQAIVIGDSVLRVAYAVAVKQLYASHYFETVWI